MALARTPLAAGRAGGAGGAGGGAGLLSTSSKYADGAHPEADLSNRLASHQPAMFVRFQRYQQVDRGCKPLPSFWVTNIISPFVILSSPLDCPEKSYRTR